jgi:REP element-mobilizing transposase RayT
LKGYDYTTPGKYFITICAQDREKRFGELINGKMITNDAGKMVETVWREIPEFYPGIDIDAFQIMPNHFHGIIVIMETCQSRGIDTTTKSNEMTHTGTDPSIRPDNPVNEIRNDDDTCQSRGIDTAMNSNDITDTGTCPRVCPDPRIRPVKLSLPDVMHRFKTMTTKRYVDGVKNSGWERFNKRLWQRSYWERIIMSERHLKRVRAYIENNPRKERNDSQNEWGQKKDL